MDAQIEIDIEEWIVVPREKRALIISMMEKQGLPIEGIIEFDRLVDEEVEKRRYEGFYGEDEA